MDTRYWLKQAADKPLYEDILWSRPEHKSGAGKLLIVGGNLTGFAAVGEAYSVAIKSGAGSVRALLPDSLRKTVGAILDNCDFAASTPSGSFAISALDEILLQANWADMVLLAGDFGRNSETAILLEKLLEKYNGPLTVTKDTVDYFNNSPKSLLDREQTAVVLSLAQLQKFAVAAKNETPFLLSMGLMLLVQALHDFTKRHTSTIVTKELESIVVAADGRVSSTKLVEDKEIWRVATATSASVFWMQNPVKPFEAITSSLVA